MKQNEAAFLYNNGEHRINTKVKQVVSVAVRLNMKAINAIDSVFNAECAESILRSRNLSSHDTKTEEDVIAPELCPLWKESVYFSALREAKIITSALMDGTKEAQVSTKPCIRHWSQLNRYWSAQSRTLTDPSNSSVLALKEEQKFSGFIGMHAWPQHMETVK